MERKQRTRVKTPRWLMLLCMLLCTSASVFAQKTVTGTVFDDTGMTVIGASVAEKGTNNGAITDIDGKFTVKVQDDAILVISYIGYVTEK